MRKEVSAVELLGGKVKAPTRDDYEVQIVCEGEFSDQGYRVMTTVFRLNGNAMNGYLEGNVINDRTSYSSEDEWVEYEMECDDSRAAWERKIKELLGWNEESGCITQNVGEIFTAVFMKKENDEDDDYSLPFC